MTLHVPRLRVSFDPLIAEAKRRATRRRFLIIAAVLGAIGLALGAAFVMHSPSGPGGTPSPSAGAKQSDSGPASKSSRSVAPGYVTYRSEGVLLGPPPKALTPRVSAAEAFSSFKRTGFAEFGKSQQPSVTLHTVTFHGNQFPAWVATYRNTKPTSYGPVRFVAPSPSCNFVGVYNLRGGAWATFFQDCPQ